jgi:hypothetical protein
MVKTFVLFSLFLSSSLTAEVFIRDNIDSSMQNIVISKSLMWQDTPDVATQKYTYEDAENYCQNLTLGDYDDWRLPEIKEIRSIYSGGYKIDDAFLINRTKMGSFWSATYYGTIGYDSNTKWYQVIDISPAGSLVTASSYASEKHTYPYVRCVRSRLVDQEKKFSFSDLGTKYRSFKIALSFSSYEYLFFDDFTMRTQDSKETVTGKWSYGYFDAEKDIQYIDYTYDQYPQYTFALQNTFSQYNYMTFFKKLNNKYEIADDKQIIIGLSFENNLLSSDFGISTSEGTAPLNVVLIKINQLRQILAL